MSSTGRSVGRQVPGGGATRRDLVAGAAGGAGVLAFASLARPEPALADAMVGLYNVKETPYSATGDGSSDDTAAIQAAIDDATSAGGGVVFLPAGSYVITGSGLSLGDHVTLEGAGRTAAQLLYRQPVGDGKLIDASFTTGVTVRELGLDGGGLADARYGIYSSENGAEKYLRIERCRLSDFRAAGGRAIYTWRSQAVWIEGNEFRDDVIPIFVDEPQADCFVIANKLWSPAGIMVNGISVSSANGGMRPLSIIGNTVESARVDPGPPANNGIDGHGIRLYNCEGAHVEGNFCRDCVTAGILVGVNSYGTHVVGNTCTDNGAPAHGAGIFVETHGADTTIGTAGAIRGASIVGNLCARNRYGISVSYSAATIVNGNVTHSNQADGIVCDSERCAISNNVAYDNWRTQPNPAQLRKAAIRVYGSRCVISGNVCYDNHSPKTQAYGIAVSNAHHIVTANQLAGNLSGGLYQSASKTNLVATNKLS